MPTRSGTLCRLRRKRKVPVTGFRPYRARDGFALEGRQVCVFVNKNRLSPVGRRTFPAGLPLKTVHHEKRIRQGRTPENRRRPKAEIHRQHTARYAAVSSTEIPRPAVGQTTRPDHPRTDRTRLSEGEDAARASRLYGPTQRHRPQPEPTDQTGPRRRFRLGRSFARPYRFRDREHPKTPVS